MKPACRQAGKQATLAQAQKNHRYRKITEKSIIPLKEIKLAALKQYFFFTLHN